MIQAVAKVMEPTERAGRFDPTRSLYLETLTLVERLHRREDGPQEGALLEHRGIAREHPREDVGEQRERDGEDGAEGDREADHPRAGGERPV